MAEAAKATAAAAKAAEVEVAWVVEVARVEAAAMVVVAEAWEEQVEAMEEVVEVAIVGCMPLVDCKPLAATHGPSWLPQPWRRCAFKRGAAQFLEFLALARRSTALALPHEINW